MRAVGIVRPDGYEAVQLIERPVPDPSRGEVRIAVAAAAVNPTDSGLRLAGGGDLPPPWTPGMDAAGVIDALGEGVTRLRPGERVMAALTPRRPLGGAQAEFIVVPEASVVPIPDGATLQQAATLPMNGLTAKLGLDALSLRAGQSLAVTGGAGLLASYVIALGKEAGLRVIADAKPEDEGLVRSFGADVVVPRGEMLVAAVREAEREGVDGVFDTALLHEAVFGAMRDGGRIVVVRGWQPESTERGIEVKAIMVSTVLERTDWLEQLRQSASAGRLQLRVAAEYPPEQAAQAQRMMDAGGLRGRVVIVF